MTTTTMTTTTMVATTPTKNRMRCSAARCRRVSVSDVGRGAAWSLLAPVLSCARARPLCRMCEGIARREKRRAKAGAVEWRAADCEQHRASSEKAASFPHRAAVQFHSKLRVSVALVRCSEKSCLWCRVLTEHSPRAPKCAIQTPMHLRRTKLLTGSHMHRQPSSSVK